MPDMKMHPLTLVGLVLCAVLVTARPASACPACQEAVVNASGKDDDDPLREARAYNRSIYLMVAVPYGTLGMLGLLVYRGYRTALKKAMAEQQLAASAGV
jgi:hypothetical protein